MQLFGAGLLMTFTEVPAELEADFNEWYNREHLDERINIAGFRRARRYEALDAEIKYLSTYEARRADDIASPAYLEVLAAQTAWSRRIMPQFSKWHRMPCRVVADRTHGMAAFLTLLRWFPEPAQADALTAWFTGDALAALSRTPEIVGWGAAAVDRAADGRLANALGQSVEPDQPVEWAVLVEGTDPAATRQAARAHLADRLAATARSETALVSETYRFLYGNLRMSDDALA